MIPPIGKLQIRLEGSSKKEGRNELIARMIKATPYSVLAQDAGRARKQIMSHIQVLKAMLLNVPECTCVGPSLMSHADEITVQAVVTTLAKPPKKTGKRLARQPLESQPFAVDHSLLGPVVHSESADVLQHQQALLSLPSFCQPLLLNTTPEVQLSYYRIWISDASGSIQTDCTVLDPGGRQSAVELASLPRWQTRFPRLSTISPTGTFECQVVLATVNCQLKRRIDGDNDKLGVGLTFTVSTSGSQWISSLKKSKEEDKFVYRCITYVSSQYGHVEFGEELTQEKSAQGTTLMGESSKFKNELAREIINISHSADGLARSRGKASAEDLAESEFDEVVDAAIESFTVVQQISRCRPNSNTSGDRIALVLWEFKSAQLGELAKTTWRNVTPAPANVLESSTLVGGPFKFSSNLPLEASQLQMQMPMPMGMSSSMPALDPALSNTGLPTVLPLEVEDGHNELGRMPMPMPMFNEHRMPFAAIRPGVLNVPFQLPPSHTLDFNTVPGLAPGTGTDSRSGSSFGSNAAAALPTHHDALGSGPRWSLDLVDAQSFKQYASGPNAIAPLGHAGGGEEQDQENLLMPGAAEAVAGGHAPFGHHQLPLQYEGGWQEWENYVPQHGLETAMGADQTGLRDQTYWRWADPGNPGLEHGGGGDGEYEGRGVGGSDGLV